MNHTPRPYQRDAVDAVTAAIHNRPILVAPTGSGKSFMGAMLVDELQRPTLWLAHRKELVTQAADHLRRVGLRVGIIKAGIEPTSSATTQVASIQTLARREKPRAELIIIDEAHHAAADTYSRILDEYPDADVVGLTATPFRLDGRGLGDLFGEIVQAATVAELCAEGYLHAPRVYASPVELDLTGCKMTAGDFNLRDVGERIAVTDFRGDILSEWKRHADGGRTVAFAVNVEHSRAITAAFVSAGIAAEHLDGNTRSDERDAILERLRTGRTRVVSNCMVLTEGFDLPALECGIIARPTASLNLHLQMDGRVMRCDDGKRGACIAEGELVLTEHGLIPIEQVSCYSRVWDGVEWVHHDGPILQGEKDVITYAGLTATRDHLTKTKEGWKAFGECSSKQIAIAQTGLGGANLRECEGYFSDDPEAGGGGEATTNIRVRPMRDLRSGILDIIREHFSRTISRLPQMQPATPRPEVAIATTAHGETAMYQSKKSCVQRLWRSWDSFQFQNCFGSRTLDTRKSRVETYTATRSYRQRRQLRAWEYSVVHSKTEYVAHQENNNSGSVPPVQNGIPTHSICGFNTSGQAPYDDVRPDSNTVGHAVVQAKRKVWDILNCGPRNCFTVSNLLVHNCILDHAGNHIRHGLVTRRIEYSLDAAERTGVSEPLGLRRCPECGLFFTPGRCTCPECGWKPSPPKSVPISADGKLAEFHDDPTFAMRAAAWRVMRDEREYSKRFGEWPVLTADGDLMDIDNATMDDKRFVFSGLTETATRKGFKPGWASYRYQSIFGVWPQTGMVSEARKARLRGLLRGVLK